MFSFLKRKKKEIPTQEKKDEAHSANITLKAFVSGKVIPMEDVDDPVFSTKMLGDGLAIEPIDTTILSPCDGIITSVMEESKHAVGIKLANGMELLIHEGIDTVALKGKGFELYVKEGDTVKTGDKLIQFNPETIKANGYHTTCILAITNSDEYPNIRLYSNIDAVAGETIILKTM